MQKLTRSKDKPARVANIWRRPARGLGYVLLWLIGVPLPIIIIIMLIRGC